MNRINLPDGRWFDADAAERWDESSRWDGSNKISLATGSQWDHERLYQTSSGHWIIVPWSQYQGRNPEAHVISAEEAARWLVRNEHELPEELEAEGAALEL